MARIISPPINALDTLRPPLQAGERMVLDWLHRKLPISWEIYIQPHLNGLRPDFVLLNPAGGIGVYEVKDWDLDAMPRFVLNDGHGVPRLMARRNGETFSVETQNPVAKVDLYKDEIFNLYCPRLPSAGGLGVIVAGVVFPYATETAIAPLLEPTRQRRGHDQHARLYPIIGRETLDDGSDAALRHVLPIVHAVDNRMSADVADDLRHWLVEAAASVEQRSPPNLSQRQWKLVTTRTEKTGYRRVRGPAGSGKTVVLAGRAARLAAEDKRVLVITFNITLINWILDLAVRFAQDGKVRKQIVALNFHAWCRRVAILTGHIDEYSALWCDGDSADVLNSRLAEAAQRWAADLSEDERWDAILVDEGQDLRPEWWSALRRALLPGGEALFCADRTQNIYGVRPWTEAQMTGAGFRGEWVTLEGSFRLPPTLCDLSVAFIEEFIPDAEALRPQSALKELQFPGPVLEWRQVAPGAAAEACLAALLDMVGESRPPLNYADVTCIVNSEEVGNALVRLIAERNIKVVHTFGQGDTQRARVQDGRRRKFAFFKGDARIKVTTLHSFKGWETRALVLHVGRAQSRENLALVYTGMTRLRPDGSGSYLTVVCEEPKLRDYGQRWPSFSDHTTEVIAPTAPLPSQ